MSILNGKMCPSVNTELGHKMGDREANDRGMNEPPHKRHSVAIVVVVASLNPISLNLEPCLEGS